METYGLFKISFNCLSLNFALLMKLWIELGFGFVFDISAKDSFYSAFSELKCWK